MNKKVLTITPNGGKICVQGNGVVLHVNKRTCLNVNRGAASDVGAWLSSLVEYDSDGAAFTAGVPINGWYKAGEHHDAIKWGTPTQVKATT